MPIAPPVAGPESRPMILFVSGTDTDVGKTYCAAAIARRLVHSGVPVGVYKPVASGCRRQVEGWIADDARLLWLAAGRPRTLRDVCPQCFEAALAPPEAARLAGSRVDPERLRGGASVWEQGGFEVLLIEGAGGLFSPIADGLLNIDLVTQFPDAKLLIVAANRLGAIHQVVSTCEAAVARGITPSAILLSRCRSVEEPAAAGNAEQIRRHCPVPIAGEIAFGGDATAIDLETILGRPCGNARC